MLKKLLLTISSLILVISVMLGIGSCKPPILETPDPTPQEQEITYTLSKSAVTIARGETYQLTMSPIPKSKVTWSSSDETVATVVNGEIRGVSVGTADIKGSIGGKDYVCKVMVTAIHVYNANITLPRYQATLPIGTEETFEAQLIVNESIQTETVMWTVQGSSDGVISEDDYTIIGNKIAISYKNVGEVTITATYGETEATYFVHVSPLIKDELSIPTGLTVQDETLSWTSVENAVAYGVKVNDLAEEIVEGTTFSNSQILREDGSYVVKVRAIANPMGDYIDSSYSNGVKVSCKYLMLYHGTINSNQDYIRFTPASTAPEKYVLLINGEETKEVQPNTNIFVSEYGESSIQVVAVYPQGNQGTRTVQFVDKTQTDMSTVPYGGRSIKPTLETTNLPAGATHSAIKFFVYPSGDGTYHMTLKNDAVRNLKAKDIVTYRIYVTNIYTNDFSKRGNHEEWDNSKTAVNTLPVSYVIGWYGANNVVSGEPTMLQKDTWYTVYTTLTNDVEENKFAMFSGLGSGKVGTYYEYELYLDRICLDVKQAGMNAVESDTTYAHISGSNNNKVSVNTNEEYVYGEDSDASLKITARGSGSYKWTNFKLKNDAYAFETGNTVSYWFRLENIGKTSNANVDRLDQYATINSIHVKGLLNPNGSWSTSSQNGTPTTSFYKVKDVNGTEVTQVNAGEWYQLIWTATYNYADEGGFKLGTHYQFYAGVSYDSSNTIMYDMYIDGFEVSEETIVEPEPEPEPEPTNDAEAKTTHVSNYGGDVTTVNRDVAYCYGTDSDASIKFIAKANEYKFSNNVISNDTLATINAGDIVTYYVRIENLKESVASSRNDDSSYKVLSQLNIKALLNPVKSYNTSSDNGIAVSEFIVIDLTTKLPVTSVVPGVWYKLTYTATADYNGSVTFAANYQYAKANNYTTDLVVKYDMYVDEITVKGADEIDQDEATTYALIHGSGNNTFSINTNKEYVYGEDSDASLKITARGSGSSKFTNFYLKNDAYAFKTGDTVSYWFRLENIGKTANANVDKLDQYVALENIHVKGVLNPHGSWSTSSQNGTATTGFFTVKNVEGEEVTQVNAGEWYQLIWTATYDYADGFKLGTHYQFYAGVSYDSANTIMYDMYIDGFTVTKA